MRCKIILTFFRNGTLVNNKTASNNMNVCSSFLSSSLGIFLIRSASSKVSFSEYSFYVRGISNFIIY